MRRTPLLALAVMVLLVACGQDPDSSTPLGNVELALGAAAELDIQRVELDIVPEEGESQSFDLDFVEAPFLYNFRLPVGAFDFVGRAFDSGDRLVAEGRSDDVPIELGEVNRVLLILNEIGNGDLTSEAPIVIEINRVPQIFMVSAPFRVEAGQPFTVRVAAEEPNAHEVAVEALIEGILSPPVPLPTADPGTFEGELQAPDIPGHYLLRLLATDRDGGQAETFKPLLVEPSTEMEDEIAALSALIQHTGTALVLPTVDPSQSSLSDEALAAWQQHLDWVLEQELAGALDLTTDANGQNVKIDLVLPELDNFRVTLDSIEVLLSRFEAFEMASSLGTNDLDWFLNTWPQAAELNLMDAVSPLYDVANPAALGAADGVNVVAAVAADGVLPAGVLRLGVLPLVHVPVGFEGLDVDGDGAADGWVRKVPGGGVMWWVDGDGDGVIDGGEMDRRDDATGYRITRGVSPDGNTHYTWIDITRGDGTTETIEYVRP